MLHIKCHGTPYEIGLQHGREAQESISRTVAFYAWQFQENCKMDWARVQQVAKEFEPTLRKKWPAYLEEMQGVADGSSRPLADIVAINVRTEITFGCFSDGCTAFSWLTQPSTSNSNSNSQSWLAQNWDWDTRQQRNLIHLTIAQPAKPTIQMITEAGLIGKIGLNSAGVGVCLNAIKARGMDPTRLPCHLGLRMVLESASREEAVARLGKYGVASACHMLVADASGGVGLEWSAVEVGKLGMNGKGQVFHTNHYLMEHPGTEEAVGWLKDSGFRVDRIEELVGRVEKGGEEVNVKKLVDCFKDEENWPGCICRSESSGIATLFNIVMELKEKKAKVTMGRPVEPDEVFEMKF